MSRLQLWCTKKPVKLKDEGIVGMKDRVDKSRVIVTLMTEALANIKPIEPLRLAKQAARIKRNSLNRLFSKTTGR